MGAGPPPPPVTRSEPSRRAKQTPQQRRVARRKKTRRRSWLIAGSALAALIAAFVAWQVMGSRAANQFNTLARSQGCGEVRTTSDSGAGEHLAEGERTSYDTSPPTHGKHQTTTLPAGGYDEPLSDDPTQGLNIYKAVHSLEHGAVIVWHDKLSDDDVGDLERRYRNEEKVLLVPYPELKGDTHVALTAWGRIMTCERSSTKVIDAFVDRFRGARSAPEPLNRI